ncbi:hypothetical protein FGO68_gene6843 [Halteria grandinella]|uniref:Uncharacterized protein n=1 Tax=Halteria grandinella TaxID=5974 RepID=A0A8J8T6R3_HALGN|nr:hypothetical protein FGO68_gene6843 [Halteria grandinella]
MGIKSRQQLQTILPHLSVTEPTKLLVPEAEASTIMRHCSKTSNFSTLKRMFPRLKSKYLALKIVGYAFFQPEAVELSYLCSSVRHFLIKNFQLFKMGVIQAEKKLIGSVFELLDERWLSKRY